MSDKKYKILCYRCAKDLTQSFPHLPCSICNYALIDGKKVKVNNECIHYTQYAMCTVCLSTGGNSIIYYDKK